MIVYIIAHALLLLVCRVLHVTVCGLPNHLRFRYFAHQTIQVKPNGLCMTQRCALLS
jgi:hypothetical protein